MKPWFQNGSLLISLHIRIFLDGCKKMWHITTACRSILGCLTARESPTLATYSQLSPCSQPQTLTPVEQSKVQPKCVQMLPAILGLPLRQGNEEPRLSRFFRFRIQQGCVNYAFWMTRVDCYEVHIRDKSTGFLLEACVRYTSQCHPGIPMCILFHPGRSV